MNTVILPLTLDGKCIAQKSGLPYVDDTLEFDILEYASQKARENGLYIYVIYDLFTGVQDGSIVELSQMVPHRSAIQWTMAWRLPRIMTSKA